MKRPNAQSALQVGLIVDLFDLERVIKRVSR
jgi:hypothetical protein